MSTTWDQNQITSGLHLDHNLDQNFDPKFFWPENFFYPKNFLTQKFFWHEKIFDPKFLTRKFFWSESCKKLNVTPPPTNLFWVSCTLSTHRTHQRTALAHCRVCMRRISHISDFERFSELSILLVELQKSGILVSRIPDIFKRKSRYFPNFSKNLPYFCSKLSNTHLFYFNSKPNESDFKYNMLSKPNATQPNSKATSVGVRHSSHVFHPTTHPTQPHPTTTNFSATSRPARELKFGTHTH